MNLRIRHTGFLLLLPLALAACATLADLPTVTAAPPDAGGDGAIDGSVPNDRDADADAPIDGSTPPADADAGTLIDGGIDTGIDAPVCGDTSRDTHNCGVCGHDCLGTSCTAGVCNAVAIVKSILAFGAKDLAVVGSNIFWTEIDDVAVRKASKVDGTGLTTLARGSAQNVNTVDTLAVSGTAVVWANSVAATGAIARCEASGCSALGKILVPNRDAPKRLFIEGDTVFWTEPTSTNVMSAKVADGTSITTISTGVGTPSAVTADVANVFWVDVDGSVYRQPRLGGPKALVAKGEAGTSAFVRVDTSTVYWTIFKDAGFVYAAPKDGANATPVTLASAQSRTNSFAIDATHIYWSNLGLPTSSSATSFREGSVYRCRLPACAGGPEAIALHQKRVFALTIDDQAVYWSAAGNRDGTTPGELDGTIWKRAK